MRALIFSVLLAAACAGQASDASTSCGNDNDCKGERVCDASLRLCVDGPAALLAPASSLDVCTAGCDARRRCALFDEAQHITCRADCASRQQALAAADAKANQDCPLAAEIRRTERLCWLAGCGEIWACVANLDRTCTAPGGGLSICRGTCAAGKRCGTLSDAQVTACLSQCDARGAELKAQDAAEDMRCKDAVDIRWRRYACTQVACNQINSCLQQSGTTCPP